MTLRGRLLLALSAAALLPMALVAGYPVVQAERRARAEAEATLLRTRRQGAILVQRERDDLAARVERAAQDLGRDPAVRQALLRGPENSARAALRAAAEREGLAAATVAGETGVPLATWTPGPEGAEDLNRISAGPASVWIPAGGGRPCIARRDTIPGDGPGAEPLSLVGARPFAESLAAAMAAIAGEPAAVVDPAGREAARAGGADEGARLPGEVEIASGWKLRSSVPAAGAARARRDALAALAGVAGLALALAAFLALVLSQRILAPVAALAARAEAIAAERARDAVTTPAGADEVRRLERAFDEMLEALAAGERRLVAAGRAAAWQEVAQRIAHEVKNPLTPIRMAVENLVRTRERAPERLGEALDDEARTILEEVESLRRLVDEFSRFARLPAPKPERCDLRDVARQALAKAAARTASLGAAVAFEDAGPPVLAVADPEQVGRLLGNVIANALDALEGVETRRLEVVVEAEESGDALVRIRDSGRGFTPEALRRVFEPYFTTRGERGGTGLGMAIAHRIAAEHGGSLAADNAHGGGAVLTLRLPRAGIGYPGGAA